MTNKLKIFMTRNEKLDKKKKISIIRLKIHIKEL